MSGNQILIGVFALLLIAVTGVNWHLFGPKKRIRSKDDVIRIRVHGR